METLEDIKLSSDYAVGHKWKNTETNNEFWITDISDTHCSFDDKKITFSTVEHMNKTLLNHLVSLNALKRVD